MRRCLLILLFGLMGWGAVAQQVTWEKSYSWVYADNLTDVIEADSGCYIACGTRSLYRIHQGTEEIPVISIIKFDSLGDTLWVKNIGYCGRSPRICRGDTGTFFLVSDVYIGFNPQETWLFTIGFDGGVRHHTSLGANFPSPKRLVRLSDGTLVFTGNDSPTTGSGNQVEMGVVRIHPVGLIYFRKKFAHNPYTFGNWIEETPRHTLLASGTAGSRIWAIEIDTNGNEVRRETFYQTPSGVVFDELANVQQAPGGRYIVSGNYLGSTVGYQYLGCYTSFSSTSRTWGGETRNAGCLPPHVNDDGSSVIYNGRQGSQFLSKIRQDSSKVWEVHAQSSLGLYPVVRDFHYLNDSSVVAVGVIDSGATSKDFYICRIKGVGAPYNPGPTSTKTRHKGLLQLIAYPTPTSGPLTVYTRSKLPLVVFSLSEKKMMQVPPDASGTTQINLTTLPPGLYLLRQGQATIKVVRE